MKLGEALLELKSRRSELYRLLEMRENSFRFRDKEVEGKEEDFNQTSKEISTLITNIRKLKIRIENTNHHTYIDTPEGKMTIAETIIYVADLRSELSSLQNLKGLYRRSDYDIGDKAFHYQVPQKEFLKQINKIESQKVRMDSFLSAYNFKTNLLE